MQQELLKPKLDMVLNTTSDQELARAAYYKKIVQVVRQLAREGSIYNMSGHCITSCDLLQHLLYHQDISARIVEVQATITKPRQGSSMPDFWFVGYDAAGIAKPGELDTHAVLITDTEIPVLIDLSIMYLMPNDSPVIIERAQVDSDNIGDYDIGTARVTYRLKRTPRFPGLAQKNLVDRIQAEHRIRSNLDRVKILVYVGLGMGLINILFNTSLLWLRWISL